MASTTAAGFLLFLVVMIGGTRAWWTPTTEGWTTAHQATTASASTTTQAPVVVSGLTCYYCNSSSLAGCSVGGEWFGGGAEVDSMRCDGRCITRATYSYSGSGYLLRFVSRTCETDSSTWLHECKTSDTLSVCYTDCATNYCNQEAPLKPASGSNSFLVLAQILKAGSSAIFGKK